MNAKHLMEQMDIAAWELAEAESAERRAAKLRRDAVKRMSAIHLEFKEALSKARTIKEKTKA